MAWHNDLGKWGEDIAAAYLKEHGWNIRHRNWSFNHHELDIVCIDDDMSTLLIVEVKTRATDAFGYPDEAITLKKKDNIIRATRAYISYYRLNYLVRYDTISIVGTPENGYKLEHKESAFDVTSQYAYSLTKRKSYYQKKHRPGCW